MANNPTTDWSSLNWTPQGTDASYFQGQLSDPGGENSWYNGVGVTAGDPKTAALLKSMGYTGQVYSGMGSGYDNSGNVIDQNAANEGGANWNWTPDALKWMASNGIQAGTHEIDGGKTRVSALIGPDGKFLAGQGDPNITKSDSLADYLGFLAMAAAPVAMGLSGWAAAGGMAGAAEPGIAEAGTLGTGTIGSAADGVSSLASQGLSPEALGLTGSVTPGVSAADIAGLSGELPGTVGKTLADYAIQGATRGAITGGLSSAIKGGNLEDILKGAALGGTVGAATGTIGSGAGQFNLGDSLGTSGTTANIVNGVGKGIVGNAISSTATGKPFDPTNALAGGAGSYVGSLGLAQDAGLDGSLASGVNNALGAGTSALVKGGDVSTALLNSAGGSAMGAGANALGFDTSSPYSQYTAQALGNLIGSGGNVKSLAGPLAGAGAQWFTTPEDQHFLSIPEDGVQRLNHEDLSLPTATPINYDDFILPGDQHMANEDDSTDNTDTSPTLQIPSFSGPDPGNFSGGIVYNSAIPSVGGDYLTGGQSLDDLTFNGTPDWSAPSDQFNQFLNGDYSSLTASDILGQVKNLGVGDSIMKSLNSLGSWANQNKTLASMLAGGLSQYANTARQDAIYQRNLDELHSQQQNYRNSVSGLRQPGLGIVGQRVLTRTDGTPVFTADGKISKGG